MRAEYRLDADQVRQSPQESPQATRPEGRLWLGSSETPPVKIRIGRNSQMFLAINRIFSEWVSNTQRATATKRMRALPFLPAQRVLLRMLHDSRYQKEWAIWALGIIGSRAAVPDLIALLGDTVLRDTAIVALGEIRDKRAAEPVCRVLNQYNKRYVLRALMQIKDERTVPLLREYVTDSDAETSGRAMAALQHMTGEDWSRRLVSRFVSGADGGGLQWRLRFMGEVATSAVLAAFEKAWEPDQVTALGDVLHGILQEGYHEDRITSAFLAKLGAREPRVRVVVLRLVRDIKRDDVVQAVITRLSDRDGGVARAAAETLGSLGSRQAIRPLLRLMHTHSRLAASAPVPLAQFQEPGIEAAIMAEYPKGNAQFRSKCVYAAKAFVSEETRSWLSRIERGDPRPEVRAMAAEVLRLRRARGPTLHWRRAN
jgi:HEAT repeat protein